MKRVALVASLALLLVGSAQAAPAQKAVTREHAALAVLPQAQLGRLAARLKVELQSGFTDNPRAADDSFDPRDTGPSVTRLGRLFGFALLYGDPAGRAIRTRKGLLNLGSSIDVFKTPKQAHAYSAKGLADLAKYRGQNVEGVILEAHEQFSVRRVGHEAIGLRLRVRFGRHVLHGTYIDFRYGRVLGEVVITRADDENVDALVLGLARKLDRRLRGVLRGSVHGRPVKLPRAAKAGRPKGAPDLAAMALKSQDTPRGARVHAQHYQVNENALASYVRDFTYGQAAAQTGVAAIRSEVDLLRSPAEASAHLLLLKSVFTSRSAAQTVASAFGSGSRIKTSNARLDEVRRNAGIGQESFATSVSFDTPLGRLRIVLVYFRSDRVIGSLVVTGLPQAFGSTAIVPLGRVMARRINAALGRQLIA